MNTIQSRSNCLTCRLIKCRLIKCRLLSIHKSFNTGKATVRSNIITEIAQKFNNVSLEDFPLSKTTDLTNFIKIKKIYNDCHDQHLDYNPNYYPSISTILNKTMSPQALNALKKWENEKIKELGFDGFQIYKKDLFSRGKILHNNIESYLKTRDTSKLQFTSSKHENFWKSIEHVMGDIQTLHSSEYPVYHPILKYRGIIDCIATYHNIPTIFEWKTSEKLKPTIAHTYDNPLQTIAYFSCLQYEQLGCHYPDVKTAILVIAYEDGSKANVHILEPSLRETIWKMFLKRLEKYWALSVN